MAKANIDLIVENQVTEEKNLIDDLFLNLESHHDDSYVEKDQESVHSLLLNIDADLDTQDNKKILANILKILLEKQYQIISTDSKSLLIKMLLSEKHPTYTTNICKLIINSSCKLDKQENINLNELQISNNSTAVLGLLLKCGELDKAALQTIFKNITSLDTDNYLYKEQLLLVAESLKYNTKLKESFLTPFMDLFRSYNDNIFLSKLLKIIDDTEFCKKLVDENISQFRSLVNLLEIEEIAVILRPQNFQITLSRPELKILNSKLDALLSSERQIVTENSLDYIKKYRGIIIAKKILVQSKDQLYKRSILALDYFAKLLDNKICISDELIDLHQKYFTAISPSAHLLQSHYQILLLQNVSISTKLLQQSYEVNLDFVEVALKNINTNNLTTPQIDHLMVTIEALLLQDNLLLQCKQVILEILTKYIAIADKSDVAHGQKLMGRILNILNKLTIHCDLTNDITDSLIDFIANKNNDETSRIKSIELLQKIVTSLTSEALSKLSSLISGEQRIIDEGEDLGLGFFQDNDHDLGKFSLGYLELDKYIRSQGWQLKPSNNFFAALENQLNILGISSTEIGIDALVDTELTDEAMRILANKLRIHINIYYFDGSIIETKAENNLTNIEINIGYSGDNYFSVIKDNNSETESTDYDLELLNQDFKRYKTDYAIAYAISELLVAYVKSNGMLSSKIIGEFVEYINNESLEPCVRKILGVIAQKQPELLDAKIIDYVKERDSELKDQICFKDIIDSIEALIKQGDISLLRQELIKVHDLSSNLQIDQMCKLHEIINIILVDNPILFPECLELLKLTYVVQKDVDLLEKLINSEQINYHDLCYFGSSDYISESLIRKLEKYLNNHIDEFEYSADKLGEIIQIFTNSKLEELTIDNLIKLAISNKSQSINIIKLFIGSSLHLSEEQLSIIMELAKINNKQLTSHIISLLKKYELELEPALLNPPKGQIVEDIVLKDVLNNIRNIGLSTKHFYLVNCFSIQLQKNDWSENNLGKIIRKINVSNISTLINSLSTIYEYQITEEQVNQQGESVCDIIDKYSNEDDLETRIYSVVVNKFEHKHENKGNILIEKIIKDNPKFKDKKGDLQYGLSKVHEFYNSISADDQVAIKDWDSQKIKDWVSNFKSIHKGKAASTNNIDEIAKIIAVLQRANNIHTERVTIGGHLLRDTQIMSLLILLDSDHGHLLQIATGEGKSTISSMLAAVLSLYGHKVDLITSSKVLADIGYKDSKGFFDIIGLTTGINTEESKTKGQKPCYSQDIVYGDSLSFQSNFLSNSSKQGAARGDREFSSCIIDEVDNMLLDGSSTSAKQSSHIPLMEFLLPIFSAAFHDFHTLIQQNEIDEADRSELARILISMLIDGLPVPKHLQAYARFQIDNWADSLVASYFKWECDRDYVINIDKDGTKIINPVNNSTGVTQENMVWQNGLHQFLQVKHSCRLSPEGLTSFFISNISYFLKYDKILGMTGTLGSDSSKEFLGTIYKTELSFIPTYKDKQLYELQPKIVHNEAEFADIVCEVAHQEAVLHKRAVLLICKTIKDAEYFYKLLQEKYGKKVKLVNYFRSEEKLYNKEIDQNVSPNTIIVATNLAGRGTDIKTSFEVEKNGGLHVLSTFLAKNARDEAQVVGRTARQGKNGTYQIIIFDKDFDPYNPHLTGSDVLQIKRELRDQQEAENIQEAFATTVPSMLARDEQYNKFAQAYLNFTLFEQESLSQNTRQFLEDFGLWLKIYSKNETIESFLERAKLKHKNGNFSNPIYSIMQSYDKNSSSEGKSLIKMLTPAIAIDDIYNFAAHYYTAKGWLDVGYKGDSDYKNHTLTHLTETKNRVEEIILYLKSMCIKISADPKADLWGQVNGKIGFFQTLVVHVDSAIKIILTSGEKHVRVKSGVPKEELYKDLTKKDLQEVHFLGIDLIFELETYTPPPKGSLFGTIFACICSVAQMAIGTLVAIGSLGTATPLAASIFSSGLMDAYKIAATVGHGRNVDIGEYLTGKVIDYALVGVQFGITKINELSKARELANAGKAAQTGGINMMQRLKETRSVTEQFSAVNLALQSGSEFAPSLAKTVAQTTIAQQTKAELFKKLIKESGLSFAKAVALEGAGNFAAKEIRNNALDGLEGRIEGSLSKKIYIALKEHVIFLDASGPNKNCRFMLMEKARSVTSKLLSSSSNAATINHLISGVLSAASGHHQHGNLATFLHHTHKIAQIADIGLKLDPIVEEIGGQILREISKLSEETKERTKNCYLIKNTDAAREEIALELSHNIGKMVACNVLNVIQGKMVSPIVTSGTNLMIDKITNSYKVSQEKILEEVRKNIQLHPQEKLPPKMPAHSLPPTLSAGDEDDVSWHSNRMHQLDKPAPASSSVIPLQEGTKEALALDKLVDQKTGEINYQALMLTMDYVQKPIFTPQELDIWSNFVSTKENEPKKLMPIYSTNPRDHVEISPIFEAPGTLADYSKYAENFAKYGKYLKFAGKKILGLGTVIGAYNVYNSGDYSGRNLVRELLPYGDVVLGVTQKLAPNLLDNEQVIHVDSYNFGFNVKTHGVLIDPNLGFNVLKMLDEPAISLDSSDIHRPEGSIYAGTLNQQFNPAHLPGYYGVIDADYDIGWDIADDADDELNPDILQKKPKPNDKTKSQTTKDQGAKPTSFMPDPGEDPDDEEKYDKFKKQDGSERYECEKAESPQWNEAKNFKEGYKTNAEKGKNIEYYRWDHKHKDIEIYNDKAQYLGSKDPVSGKIYRQGDFKVNRQLENLL